ncbi:MAG: DUF4058 family protein [Planctomycetes bacterium]|nr:DUF4058 family protein [Planctomycetota bacterium]
MPSPFPGMDPYIESQVWEDFHSRFVPELATALVPQLRPRYESRVERRVYVARTTGEPGSIIIPDVAVLMRHGTHPPSRDIDSSGGPAVAVETEAEVAVRPVVCQLPRLRERRETFLTIRHCGTLEVVTVIELLSPDNKQPGHKGRRKYLRKRNAVLDSPVSLVELDLLRGGARLPMDDPLPVGDYYAIVSRGLKFEADVYAWSLRQRLPPIPIPLADDDPDVLLDLQAVFTTFYDRAGYDYMLDYVSPVHPPLSADDAEWAAELLKGRGSGPPAAKGGRGT